VEIDNRRAHSPRSKVLSESCLPCGCEPTGKHAKGCGMWRPGYSTAVYQCEAVVEMFEQLNALWRIKHGMKVPA
jgi:hypothetical protein